MSIFGEIAQLARASGSYPAGREFESPSRYQKMKSIACLWILFLLEKGSKQNSPRSAALWALHSRARKCPWGIRISLSLPKNEIHRITWFYGFFILILPNYFHLTKIDITPLLLYHRYQFLFLYYPLLLLFFWMSHLCF